MSVASQVSRPSAAPAASRFAALDDLPLALTLVLYAAACFWIYRSACALTHGTWVYPLDDVYIGMAIARNFSFHGVWGISHTAFSSATSTPLYVFLLSIILRLTGVHEITPLVVSSVFGAASLVVVSRWTSDCSLLARLIALLGVTLLVPLYIVGILGMEHTLQILLVLLFAWQSSRLAQEPRASIGWKLALVTALMVGTRYETIFLVAAAVAWFGVQRRFRVAVEFCAAGWSPIILFGLISLALGWPLLPAPIALKGADTSLTASAWSGLIDRFSKTADRALHVWAVVMAVIAVAAVRASNRLQHLRYILWLVIGAVVARLLYLDTMWIHQPLKFAVIGVSALVGVAAVLVPWFKTETRYLIWILICGTLFHLAMADVGWVYRYEAYLLVLGMVLLARVMGSFDTLPPLGHIAVVVILYLAADPLVLRASEAPKTVAIYSHDIWSQQYQMSEFFRRYYYGASVAANDIGAISLRADLNTIDLVGLADQRVFRDRKAHRFTTEALADETVAHNVQIAVVFDSWFSANPRARFPEDGPHLPPAWQRAGRWLVSFKRILGSSVVSFYALHPEDLPKLKSSLADFARSLPSEVTYTPD